MDKKSQKFSALFFVSFLSLSLLTGCTGKKAPEDVLTKAQQAIVSLNSGKLTMKATVAGKSDKYDLQVEGDLSSTFSKLPPNDVTKLSLIVGLKGSMKSPEKEVNLETAFQAMMDGSEYYVQLNDFETNEENLQFLIPLVSSYKNKWLHLSENFIPENISGFQRTEADEGKKKQLQDLFIASKLFIIKKDQGSEKINGREVYVLSLEPNKEGFRDYLKRLALLNEAQITDADLEGLLAVLDKVRELQVYIDAEEYYVQKANLIIKADPLDKTSTLELTLAFEGSAFDQPIQIEAPKVVEEFDPLALPAALGSTSNPTAPLITTPSELPGVLPADAPKVVTP